MRILFLLPVVFFAVACKDKNGVPHGVLSQKKMQAILWDMMRTDQFLSDYVLNKDTSINAKTESLKYYQQIFTLHNVSRDEFQKSFSFYKSHPALLKEIMDSISTPPLSTTSANPDQQEPVTSPVNNMPDTMRVGPRTIQQDNADTLKRKKKLPVPKEAI